MVLKKILFAAILVNLVVVQVGFSNSTNSNTTPHYDSFKRFVFSYPDVMYSFEIPAELANVNYDEDILRLNSFYGFSYRTKRDIRLWRELIFSGTTCCDFIAVNHYFQSQSLNLNDDDVFCCKKPAPYRENLQFMKLDLTSRNLELLNFKIGRFELPLFIYDCGNHLFPYQMYSSIVKSKTTNMIFVYQTITIYINHLMAVEIVFFRDKINSQSYTILHKISKSIRLHKFTFSNTGLFDEFENKSGFFEK